MIDIHNHILFGVDDGSGSLEQSIAMLQKAAADGITEIILTPHYIPHGEYRESFEGIEARFRTLKNTADSKGIPITLHLGNELFIDKDLDIFLDSSIVHTMAGSVYVLVEFPMDEYRDEYDEYLYNIRISGYKIIIAHPERYLYVQRNPEFVMRWIDEGYLLQCNASSLNSEKKAKVMNYLLRKGLLPFIASDAHNECRPALLMYAFKRIERAYSKEIAERIFEINPAAIINNEEVEEMPVEKHHWFHRRSL